MPLTNVLLFIHLTSLSHLVFTNGRGGHGQKIKTAKVNEPSMHLYLLAMHHEVDLCLFNRVHLAISFIHQPGVDSIIFFFLDR